MSTSIFYKTGLFTLWLFPIGYLCAQVPDSVGAVNTDTGAVVLNRDAIYQRPFIYLGQAPAAVGGYMEGNTNYFAEDGVSEGLSFELRRFNIFLHAFAGKRLRFLSELEFEHGTEEISLETAILDFEWNDLLNFRAGILLPTIGLFNVNHDSPKWEFVERPLSSTLLIPTTLSEVGFGLFGKHYFGGYVLGYDAYLVNGLQEKIILNEKGRTFIPAGKSEEMFGEDNNGTPMYNARISFAHRVHGELGISYYGGVYNRFREEGVQIEKPLTLSLLALDAQTSVKRLDIKGEWVWAYAGVPENLLELYATRQYGGFLEVNYPFFDKNIPAIGHIRILANLRGEYIDFNAGTFRDTGLPIRDDILAFAGGISVRPSENTVFRANYRYHWTTDAPGNSPVRSAGFQFGLATYF